MTNAVPAQLGITPTPIESFNWTRFLRRFTPLFAIAAFLPVVLNLAFTFSQADRSNEVRLWFEPDTVVAKLNQPVTLSVMAAFEDDTRLMASIDAQITGPGEVLITPTQLTNTSPFRGTITMKQIQVQANAVGTYTITLPPQTVTTGFGADITAITSPATLIVKE